jgi:triacylglycerol lipase
MNITRRIACLAACLGLAAAAVPSTVAAARTSRHRAAASGPAITVPVASLRAAMHCRGKLVGARKDPVLLIPGTFGWGAINWGWNYQKLLPKLGWPACTVDMPAHGAGDIQIGSQYVVYAIRAMVQKSGRDVALIGHSQGGLEARWALKWWPDLRSHVSDVITLAAPNGGALYTNDNCNTPGSCATSLYQMRSDSKFLRALNAGREETFGLPFTAITTTTDHVFVTPAEGSLQGAANLVVQQLCPGHDVDHVSLAFDGPTYAIVRDALTHAGTAKLSRINRSVCSTDTMPGVTRTEANAKLAEYSKILAVALGPNGPRAQGEPRLARYVTAAAHRGHER